MKRMLWLWVWLVTTPAWAVEPCQPDAARVGPAATCPLKVGQVIPPVTVARIDGAEVNLAEFLAGKPTVLVFVRGGWCPYCSAQMQQLRQIEGPLRDIGYQLVTVSSDPVPHLKASLTGLDLKYTVLSDAKGEVARAFGLAYRPDPAQFGSKYELAAWRKRHPDQAEATIPVPAVFVVHGTGTIIYQYVNVDYRVRLSAEVLLTVAQAYAAAG